MSPSVIAIRLLNELEIQSDNRVEPVRHMWFPIQETAKSLGIRRKLVFEVLEKMVEFEIIKAKTDQPASYEFTERGKRISQEELAVLFRE